MSDAKRYALEVTYGPDDQPYTALVPAVDGPVVLHEDYAALAAENRTLREKLERALQQIIQIRAAFLRPGRKEQGNE